MARSLFYAMISGQHAEPPPAKRRGPKPAISDQALLVNTIEADDWRHRPGRARATARSGLGFGSVAGIRVARKRVLRLMRENNLLSPQRCRRRGGNPHDGEIITHAPNLMWGTDGRSGVHGATTAGAGSSPPSSNGTPSVSAGMSARAATASPPCSRSPWGLPGCMARPRPARLGGWPSGWITAPSICRTTSPTRSSSGASSASYAFVAEPQTNGVAERSQSHR